MFQEWLQPLVKHRKKQQSRFSHWQNCKMGGDIFSVIWADFQNEWRDILFNFWRNSKMGRTYFSIFGQPPKSGWCIFLIFSLVRPNLQNAQGAGGKGGMDCAHLVSTARVFEVERRMIAQNDPLNEAVHPRTKFFFRLTQVSLSQPKNGHFRQNQAFLVSLVVSFEVERRMIAQNGPLDEANNPRTEIFFRLTQVNLSQPKKRPFSAKIKLFW